MTFAVTFDTSFATNTRVPGAAGNSSARMCTTKPAASECPGRGVLGNAVVDTMMIGDDQPLRRHEASGAGSEADDRIGWKLGQLCQRIQVEGNAGGLQFPGDLWRLLRHLHDFIRVSRIYHLERHSKGRISIDNSISNLPSFLLQDSCKNILPQNVVPCKS